MRDPLQRRKLKAAFPQISVFFGVSAFSLKALGVPPARRVPVYGGGSHVLRADSAETLPRVDFTFVGRVMPHKGLHMLLHSAMPAGASLRVLGPSVTWATDYGKSIRSQLEDQGHAVISDATDSMLRSALEATQYLVMPTLGHVGIRPLRRPELLGLVALEAAAVGVPSILSTAGALREVAPLIGAQSVRSGSVTAWRSALGLASQQPPTRPEVSPLCTWPHCA